MAQLEAAIALDIKAYWDPCLAECETNYLCVYGSSVYEKDCNKSDIDLFVVTDARDFALSGLVNFVNSLHETHEREIDVEVPYANKVLYTSNEINQATSYSGFTVNGSVITIPPIEKTQEYLSSPAVKARLALNALTTPHLVIGKNYTKYNAARSRAEKAVTLLSAQLTKQPEFTVDDMYDALSFDDCGNTGEMFLGYKVEHHIVEKYLRELLYYRVERLVNENILEKSDESYRVCKDFNPVVYMQNDKV
jgi:predicted nucleotidyltransferase